MTQPIRQIQDKKALPAGPLRRSFSEASRQEFINIIVIIGIVILASVVG